MRTFTLSICLLALLTCWGCTLPTEADIQTIATIRLLPPEGVLPERVSVEIQYTNMNTLEQESYPLTDTLVAEQKLLRGLYTVYVDGSVYTNKGDLLHVRGRLPDCPLIGRRSSCEGPLSVLP